MRKITIKYLKTNFASVIVGLSITNISFTLTVPNGFQIFAQDNGVTCYKSSDEDTYVHIIDLASKASFKLLVSENEIKTTSDPNQKYYREPLSSFNVNDENYYFVSSGTYFENYDDKTPICLNQHIFDL